MADTAMLLSLALFAGNVIIYRARRDLGCLPAPGPLTRVFDGLAVASVATWLTWAWLVHAREDTATFTASTFALALAQGTALAGLVIDSVAEMRGPGRGRHAHRDQQGRWDNARTFVGNDADPKPWPR